LVPLLSGFISGLGFGVVVGVVLPLLCEVVRWMMY
jgi:hypothetical protein